MIALFEKYRLQVQKLAIILGTLVAVLGFGLLFGKVDPLYVGILAGMPFLLLGTLFLMNHLEVTPVLILVVAAFIPLSLPTGTGSRLVLSLVATCLCIGLWIIWMLIKEKRFYLSASPANLPLFGFIGTTGISLVWSNVFRDPVVVVWDSFLFVQLASTLVMILLPGALLLVANKTADIRSLTVMVTVFLIAGGLGIISNLGSLSFGNFRLPVETRGLTAMWIVSCSTGLLLFHRKMPGLWRLLCGVLIIGWAYWGFILHRSWLAGWLPLVLVLAIIGFMRSKFLGLILMILLGYLLYTNYIITSALDMEAQISGLTRLAAWGLNWRVTSQHLLFGTGPAGYAAYYMFYFPFEGMASHNNYLDIFAQTGIVGLIFCIWFFVVMARKGLTLCQRFRGQGNFQEALANSMFAGTVGCMFMMFFGDWLFPFAYTQTIAGFNYAVYSWLFMGMTLALERLAGAQQRGTIMTTTAT